MPPAGGWPAPAGRGLAALVLLMALGGALAACPNAYVSCSKGSLSDDCNKCNCPAGFTGVRCDACTSDAACDTGSSFTETKCVNAFYLYQDATFDCDGGSFLSLINSYWATVSCSRADRRCRFVAYFPGRLASAASGTSMRFFACDMIEAQATFDPVTLDFSARSASTACKCEHPDCDISAFLEPVRRPASLVCQQNTSSCKFMQPDLPDLIGPDGIVLSCPRRGNCIPRAAVPAALLGLASSGGDTGSGAATNPLLRSPSANNWNRGLVLVLAIGVPLTAALILATALLACWPVPRAKAPRVGDAPSLALDMGGAGEGEPPPLHSVEFAELCCWAPAARAGLCRRRPPRGPALLSDAWGRAGRGELLAIMGESGAGKTTLLDCVSGRKTIGTVSGRFWLDGRPSSPAEIRSISGYVQQQMDELSGLLTVREALTFAALLRMPRAVPRDAKLARAEEVMETLDLAAVAEQRIGGPFARGISGGERRRVGIGQELVTAPRLLFLDEPTSGLDGYHAGQLVAALAALCRARRTTVVLTIHQPRPAVLAEVSALLLLSRGRVVFSGPAALAEQHFRERLGLAAPPAGHVADAALDAMSGGAEATRARILAAAEAARAGGGKGGLASPLAGEAGPEEAPAARASFGQQVAVLSRRAALLAARNSALLKVNAAVALLVGVLCGLAFLRIGSDLYSIQNRAGLSFFASVFVAFASLSSLETLAAERLVFVRERAAGAYSPLAYFLTKVAFDVVPLRLLPAVLFGLPVYFVSGLAPDAGRFFLFLAALCLLYLAVVALCLAVSAAAPSPSVASAVAGIFLLLALFFGGSLVQADSIKEWLRWLTWLSPFKYAFEIWMAGEFAGSVVTIAQDPLPAVALAGDTFVAVAFGLRAENVARDFVVLALLCAAYLAAAYGALLLFARERR